MSPRISIASTNWPRVTSVGRQVGSGVTADAHEGGGHGERDEQQHGNRAFRAGSDLGRQTAGDGHRGLRAVAARLRSMTAPSVRPEVMTASCAFIDPTVTV